MAKRTLTATTPDGGTVCRVTERAYSYVVVGYVPKDAPLSGEGWYASIPSNRQGAVKRARREGGWVAISWHGSVAHAGVAASKPNLYYGENRVFTEFRALPVNA